MFLIKATECCVPGPSFIQLFIDIRMKSVLLLVVAVFSACSAVPIAENCPLYVFPVIGFHLPSYLGPWYEIQRYEQDFQAGGDCVNAYYDTYPNGSVSIYNSMIVLGAPPTLHDVYGLGVVAWPEADPVQGILNVTFTGGPPDTANYRIIGTDYVNYAVVYNCVDIITNVSERKFYFNNFYFY